MTTNIDQTNANDPTDNNDPTNKNTGRRSDQFSMYDEWAIGRLQSRYGDAVSRQAWAELPAMFTDDCPINLDLRGTDIHLVGGESVANFIAASVGRFEFFEFALLNSVIDLIDADTATGRLYIWELRQLAEDHRWTNAYGLYRDRYQKVGDEWRFSERRYCTLARSQAQPEPLRLDVFPIPAADRPL